MLLGALWSWRRYEVVLVKWRDGVVECCSGEAVSSGEGEVVVLTLGLTKGGNKKRGMFYIFFWSGLVLVMGQGMDKGCVVGWIRFWF